MCTLYNVRATRGEIASYFQATDDWGQDLGKDYVATDRPGWVVLRDADGSRRLTAMKWGWPPPKNVRGSVVNVRNYTSPFWRSALANPARRCLVPVTEFQEWSVACHPETGKKTKHWFNLPSRPIFAFAGVWRPCDPEPVYAFLTCGYDGDPANHCVGAIHPKAIPVILHDDDQERWLSAPIEEALPLACAFPSQLMAVRD